MSTYIMDNCKNINRRIIAENLKRILRTKKISLDSLSNKSNLSRSIIDNIYYGRSVTTSSIEKIAKTLNIDTSLLFDEPLSYSRYNPFDSVIYSKIVSQINLVILKYNLEISKNILEKISHTIYVYYNDFTNIEDACKGIILNYLLTENDDIKEKFN